MRRNGGQNFGLQLRLGSGWLDRRYCDVGFDIWEWVRSGGGSGSGDGGWFPFFKLGATMKFIFVKFGLDIAFAKGTWRRDAVDIREGPSS
jgi:hypothetical protein